MRRILLALIALAAGLSSSCASQPSATCQPGAEGCACSNGLCLGGLECVADQCISPTASSESSNDDNASDDDANDDTPPDSDTSTSDGSDTDPPGTTSSSSPSAPMILELFTDETELVEGGFLMITAQVTDADGLDDIVGGLLKTGDGTGTYGAFDQVSQGTYSTLITWDQLVELEQPVFEGTGTVMLIAEFTDTASEVGSRTLELTVACESPSHALCGETECRSISGDAQNCGACGNQCSNDETCEVDTCTTIPPDPPSGEWSECFDLYPTPDYATCDEACADAGLVCNTGCSDLPGAGGVMFFDFEACEALNTDFAFGTPPDCGDEISAPGQSWARCCCWEP
jgi:hypothetical protein